MSWEQVKEEATDLIPTVGITDLEVKDAAYEVTQGRKVKRPAKAKESILREAETIIYGDREKTYGHPAKNLKTIASMWNAYLNNTNGKDFALTAKDVAAMMMLVKVARFANDPNHRDNLVDVCGYAALIERCDEVQK
jgi:hypothetical protein